MAGGAARGGFREVQGWQTEAGVQVPLRRERRAAPARAGCSEPRLTWTPGSTAKLLRDVEELVAERWREPRRSSSTLQSEDAYQARRRSKDAVRTSWVETRCWSRRNVVIRNTKTDSPPPPLVFFWILKWKSFDRQRSSTSPRVKQSLTRKVKHSRRAHYRDPVIKGMTSPRLVRASDTPSAVKEWLF